MRKGALVSVSNRDGLIEMCRTLIECGYELMATSGTRKTLSEQGLESISIEEYTGQKEILDGRVKTLHPKIHAGLLAKRSSPAHMAELEREGIIPIDVALVNLYPFLEVVKSEKRNDPAAMVEYVDIGGPTMIRAASKNFRSVIPVIDPADYGAVAEYVRSGASNKGEGLAFRAKLAAKVFTTMAHYDLQVAKYFADVEMKEGGGDALSYVDSKFPPVEGVVLSRVQELRYGENPHQNGALYRDFAHTGAAVWEKLGGKELSYNNLLDLDAAMRLTRDLVGCGNAVAIIKHLNPCGVAYDATLLGALRKAKQCDPRSHFGGVVCFTAEVGEEVAREVREDFAEIVIAPGFTAAALTVLRESKNLRIISVPSLDQRGTQSTVLPRELRSVASGYLLQESDTKISEIAVAKNVTGSDLTDGEARDAALAWRVCAHVKSNAIVLVKNGMVIGVGAGQMSRIDSVELALSKAKTHSHDVHGAVCASDAFFPFADNVERLGAEGISAVVVPSGAKRDAEVIEVAKKAHVKILFTEDRHFRH